MTFDVCEKPRAHAPDRRMLERHVAVCRVGLIHSSVAKDFCRIKNISAGGFMARIYHETSVGDEIQIELKSGQLFAGTVVWTQDEHAGVAFRDRIDIEAALSSQNIAEAGQVRRLPRMGLDHRVRMRCGSRYHSGRVCDISQSGAQVQTTGSLAPDTSVSIMLRDFPPIAGSVRWTRGTRAGICFNEAVQLELLVRWIQDRRADLSGLALIAPGDAPPIAADNQN